MKKNITFIIALLLVLLIGPKTAFAYAGGDSIEFNNTTTQNTTSDVFVGDVEVPVYEVNLSWEGFVFDWRYDHTTQSYGWTSEHRECVSEVYDATFDPNTTIYTDGTCSVEMAEPPHADGEVVYYWHVDGPSTIVIDDNSTGGYVTPALSFAPANYYNFTTGEFRYEANRCQAFTQEEFNALSQESNGWIAYLNNTCSGEAVNIADMTWQANKYYGDPGIGNDFHTYSGGELPAIARLGRAGDENGLVDWSQGASYYVEFYLGVDHSKTVRTPVKDERIGSITVTLTAH